MNLKIENCLEMFSFLNLQLDKTRNPLSDHFHNLKVSIVKVLNTIVNHYVLKDPNSALNESRLFPSLIKSYKMDNFKSTLPKKSRRKIRSGTPSRWFQKKTLLTSKRKTGSSSQSPKRRDSETWAKRTTSAPSSRRKSRTVRWTPSPRSLPFRRTKSTTLQWSS